MSFRVILHTEFLSGSVSFNCSSVFPRPEHVYAIEISSLLWWGFSCQSRFLILRIIDAVGLVILLGGAILQIIV